MLHFIHTQKQVMIGGKPITVQMPAGQQRTLTLVGNQVTGGLSSMGKLVCIPTSTNMAAITTSTTSDGPKLMVVRKQPSATIGKSFSFFVWIGYANKEP